MEKEQGDFMIIGILQTFHKVLNGARESIERQQKENAEMAGYLKGIQTNIKAVIEENKTLNQEAGIVQRNQQGLFDQLIQLGILSPIQNETVYGYAERIIHLIHTQNKQHKKETKDCQELPEFDEEKSKLEAEMNCIKSLVNLGMEYSQAEHYLQNIKYGIRIKKIWEDAARQNGIPKYQSPNVTTHA